VALLPAEAFYFRNGDPGDADIVQRILHIVELEGLDDRFDLLHAEVPMRTAMTLMPNPGLISKAGAPPQ
jgi:hypothetical protein